MDTQLLLSLFGLILGSSVLTAVATKVAEYIMYKTKRKDAKQDSKEDLSGKLDKINSDVSKLTESLESKSESLSERLSKIDSDLEKVHETLGLHSMSIEDLNKLSKFYCDRFLEFEKKQGDTNGLQNEALVQILGEMLKERAYAFIEEGSVSFKDYEYWVKDYSVYNRMHGNSVVEQLKKELQDLPKVHK